MKNLKVKLIWIFGIGIFLLSSNVYALTILTGDALEYVTLNHISVLGGDGTNLISPRTYNATAGVLVAGDNDDNLSNPDPNIGQFYDGILNGESILTGLEFITNADLQDIDGDGIATDPGWIHLAGFNPDGEPQVVYDTAGPNPYITGSRAVNIADVLTLTFVWDTEYTSASWLLETKPDKIADIIALLGPSIFDHLAFSLKVGNAFAVYDFNFNTIFEAERDAGNDELSLKNAYVLGGTLNTQQFLKNGNRQDISHINVWARDPADYAVPEPATMALLGMGLIALAGIGRKRYKKE